MGKKELLFMATRKRKPERAIAVKGKGNVKAKRRSGRSVRGGSRNNKPRTIDGGFRYDADARRRHKSSVSEGAKPYKLSTKRSRRQSNVRDANGNHAAGLKMTYQDGRTRRRMYIQPHARFDEFHKMLHSSPSLKKFFSNITGTGNSRYNEANGFLNWMINHGAYVNGEGRLTGVADIKDFVGRFSSAGSMRELDNLAKAFNRGLQSTMKGENLRKVMHEQGGMTLKAAKERLQRAHDVNFGADPFSK